MKIFFICLANFFLPGLGYLFIPRRAHFGYALLTGMVFVIIVDEIAQRHGIYNVLTALRMGGYWKLYGYKLAADFTLNSAFAYDAYRALKLS
jgi:hypothetical protein